MALPDLCRKHGISDKTYYRYKRIYGSTNDSQMARLNQVEQEKSAVAEARR